MATIPTLDQLFNDIISDLETEFGVNIPVFGKNYLRIRAMVQAARLKKYYLAIGKLQKNVFADLADSEQFGGTLERFGLIKLGRPPFPATSGEYVVQFTGTDGAVIPAFLPIKSDDNSTSPGFLFVLDNPFTLAAPQQAQIRALTPGLESRLVIGDTLTITSPIANVESQVTVLSEAVIPQAAEDLEEYREKILEAFRLEPQGGAGADYRIWAGEAQGVDQTYPFAASGQPNEVNLFIEATVVDSIDGKGTPSGATITAVTSAIEDPTPTRPSRKPLTVTVNYIAITPLDVDITINDFVGLTASVQALIEAEIGIVISNIRPFVSSIDVVADKNDVLDTNRIIAAILSVAPGSVFGTIDLLVDSNPVTTFTFENGDIPFDNSITFAP